MNFMPMFKSAIAILPELKKLPNGTLEPMDEIQKNILAKTILFKHCEGDIYILQISLTCPRVCQIQDLGQSE